MLLYHGSLSIVDKPCTKFTRDNLDFGKGFYLTDIKPQAIRWIKSLQSRKRISSVGYLNIYVIDLDYIKSNFKVLVFEDYSEDWLDFVLNCRQGSEEWQNYDCIIGGVADDRIYDTIQLYISGFLNKDEAITRFKYFKENNQICIINQNILDSFLIFKGYEVINYGKRLDTNSRLDVF